MATTTTVATAASASAAAAADSAESKPTFVQRFGAAAPDLLTLCKNAATVVSAAVSGPTEKQYAIPERMPAGGWECDYGFDVRSREECITNFARNCVAMFEWYKQIHGPGIEASAVNNASARAQIARLNANIAGAKGFLEQIKSWSDADYEEIFRMLSAFLKTDNNFDRIVSKSVIENSLEAARTRAAEREAQDNKCSVEEVLPYIRKIKLEDEPPSFEHINKVTANGFLLLAEIMLRNANTDASLLPVGCSFETAVKIYHSECNRGVLRLWNTEAGAISMHTYNMAFIDIPFLTWVCNAMLNTPTSANKNEVRYRFPLYNHLCNMYRLIYFCDPIFRDPVKADFVLRTIRILYDLEDVPPRPPRLSLMTQDSIRARFKSVTGSVNVDEITKSISGVINKTLPAEQAAKIDVRSIASNVQTAAKFIDIDDVLDTIFRLVNDRSINPKGTVGLDSAGEVCSRAYDAWMNPRFGEEVSKFVKKTIRKQCVRIGEEQKKTPSQIENMQQQMVKTYEDKGGLTFIAEMAQDWAKNKGMGSIFGKDWNETWANITNCAKDAFSGGGAGSIKDTFIKMLGSSESEGVKNVSEKAAGASSDLQDIDDL